MIGQLNYRAPQILRGLADLELRAVARDRQGFLGVYGSTVEPGRVAASSCGTSVVATAVVMR